MRVKFGVDFQVRVAALVAALVVLNGVAQARDRQVVADRIVVKLSRGASTQNLAARLQSLGCHARGATAESLTPDAADTVRVDVNGVDRVQLLNELAARTDVRFAAPVYNYAPAVVPNDPRFSAQYHHRLMNSSAAWDITQGSTAIPIAILDTGVDPDHPDLSAKLLPGFNAFSNNSDTHDVEGHGTAVAGCAAALTNNGVGVAGMSWNSPIIPVRISDTNGLAPSDAIADGIRWAADNGAKVINISFGPLQDDTIVLNAAGYARSRGALVFASMGNDGRRESSSENANIIFVSATDANDNAADFTSFGPAARLAAPGVSIPSTVDGGGFGNWSGTSFSSPIAAGAAALVWAVNPSMTPAQVESILFSTARDLGNAGRDELFGFGRVDVGAAVARAQSGGVTLAKADLTNPAPGGRITSSTVTFNWTAGSGATSYFLYVGTTANPSLYFGQPVGLNRSQTVSGLPLDGSNVQVYLYTELNGVFEPNVYNFATGPAPAPVNVKANLTSPTPGSTFGSSTATFSWDAGQNALQYWLSVGTVAEPGKYFDRDLGTARTQTVTTLPTDSSTVQVRVWSRFVSGWQFNAYTFTASTPPVFSKANLTNPAPNSTLAGSSAVFEWDGGSGAREYWLFVGTDSQPRRFFDGSAGLNRSARVDGLPLDGTGLKVSLFTLLNGRWEVNTYRFTAATVAPARLTAPVASAPLSGATVAFEWSAAAGASAYWLSVGTPGNASRFFDRSMGLAQSQTVSGLPTDGSTVRVTLWTLFGSSWRSVVQDFTAAEISAAKATMTSPTPGSAFTSRTVTFSWSAGTNVSRYWLDIGTGTGRADLFSDDMGRATTTTLRNFPADGRRIFVRLWSLIGGRWQFQDVVYTAVGGAETASIR